MPAQLLLSARSVPGTVLCVDMAVFPHADMALSPHAQESHLLPRGLMLQPRTLSRVVTLLQDLSRPDVAAAAATALVHCCSSPDEVRALLAAGAPLKVSGLGVCVTCVWMPGKTQGADTGGPCRSSPAQCLCAPLLLYKQRRLMTEAGIVGACVGLLSSECKPLQVNCGTTLRALGVTFPSSSPPPRPSTSLYSTGMGVLAGRLPAPSLPPSPWQPGGLFPASGRHSRGTCRHRRGFPASAAAPARPPALFA